MLSPPDLDLARRDAALPGLATILDPAAMVAVLQRARPGIGFDDATIHYVRYKPGTSCLVGYRVKVDGEDVLFGAQARRPDARDKLAKARAKPGVSGRLGPGRFVITDLALIISVFPNDRRLPQMERLADPGKVRGLVRELAADYRPARGSRLEMLDFRPGRRWVARLVGESGPVVLVKVHAKRDFARAWRNAASFTSRDSLIVPEPVGKSPGWHAVAVEWICGESPDPTPANAVRIGTALASLHAQDVDMAVVMPREGQVRALRTVARDLARLWPPLGARCRRIAKRLGSALLEESGALRPIHGDFYADQIVLAGDRIGLIDFDESALGSPAWDLGNFIGHLYYRSLAGAIGGDSHDAIGDGLIEGYLAAGGETSVREVVLQTAASLMRLAALPFRERDPRWPDRIEQILVRVEELVATAASAGMPRSPSIDPALPLIEQALDRGVAARHFARDALVAGRWRIEQAQLVRHKPGRRCLIEYRLTDANERTILLGKMRARGADRRAYALQRELWETTFGPAAADRIMVSEPVAIVPELGLWLQRKDPGRALTDLLDPATVPDPARIALAIAKLHRSGIAARRQHTLADELRILGERLSSLARRRPEWANRIDAALKAATLLARRAEPAKERSIHRDFYPDHVLVHGDELRILDLDLWSAGDAAVDIGNFLAHVIEHGLRLRGRADFLADWRAEFEDAYRRLAGDVSIVNIRIYELLTLLRLVEISTRILDRQPYTEVLLEECERRLETAFVGQGMSL
ncbi:MAG: aminoglycoside phosphotransferase family protein [Sphingomonas bacterium]|nr:aminoglycoside phosphotransferase family protein [Sphingomonas bacterium]